ncbi:DNA recombination protein RmuC [Kineococcus sp. NBC_00420]|uniref:DNA recombination protein RmuC n=1 Tax=unclassified Kineococcus TaxID=2621656 RepID=UPI002E2477B5
MDVSALLLTLVLGLLAGIVVGVLLTRWVHRTRTAPETTALSTERDLLRARVADLEERVSTGHALTSTVTPVTASLQRVEAQVAALERDRVAQYARLSEQLTAVAAGTDALRDQTATLAGALRASSSRGSWGEVQLRRVVEHAGMLDRVDFTEQATLTTRSRPR